MSFLKGVDKLSMGVSFGMMRRNEIIFVWGKNGWG
jgi:hypothetical protein